MTSSRTLALIACSAGGVEQLGSHLVEPLLDRGWTVAITLTPTAATWLASSAELARLESLTGLPVRFGPRLPHGPRPHPAADGLAVVPATANSVAKMALGISDNQAMTQVCETIGAGSAPVVVFPRVNAGHARQPAWANHLGALRQAGVRLIYGEDVWPLHEPRSEPGKSLPWGAILHEIDTAIPVR